MTKPKKPVVLVVDPFNDYVDEVAEIAGVIAAGGKARDRAYIRTCVRAHIDKLRASEHDTTYWGVDTNRLDAVTRALCIGITKMLEAWDYVEMNQAWPPKGDG